MRCHEPIDTVTAPAACRVLDLSTGAALMRIRAVVSASIWLLSATALAVAQAPQSPENASHASATSTPSGPAETLPDPSGYERWASGRYRLTASDVIEVTFPYVPEFDQTLTVQPDGYVTLKGVGEIRAQSRTVPEFRQLLLEAYTPILRDPVVTITLKEFEKPYFIATGEVKNPGKFELRGALTVTQGLAVAGGNTPIAKHSQVVLFRRYSEELVETKQIDVKKMMASKDLSEDYLLRPGDMVYVPKSVMAQLKPFIPTAAFYLLDRLVFYPTWNPYTR
jgi:polysaccharide export outer membrane protein